MTSELTFPPSYFKTLLGFLCCVLYHAANLTSLLRFSHKTLSILQLILILNKEHVFGQLIDLAQSYWADFYNHNDNNNPK